MKVDHVVTYYDPVENLWTHESQIKLIDVWRRSWEKAGWTTTVLSQGNVKCHPRFHFFNDHCQAKPTEYPRSIPWLALCAGWPPRITGINMAGT